MGIEPTSSAWKAEALPLCYTRFVFKNVPVIYEDFPTLQYPRSKKETVKAQIVVIAQSLMALIFL